MKIAFVIANAYGMGGTVRTVYNIAEGLAARNEVEVVSLARHREEPFFDVPPGVGLRPLADAGARAEQAAAEGRAPGLSAREQRWARRAERIIPEAERRRNKSFTPPAVAGLRRYLETTDADVVVGTRPGINLLLAAWAPRRLIAIGQEHVNLGEHKPEVRDAIARLYPRLDGTTVLTEADRRAYRKLLGDSGDWQAVLPNPLPQREVPRSTQDNPIIAAAGRLSPIKQYPKLLKAFSAVAEKHPDWRLRIYGSGKEEEKLRRTIVEQGLSNQVHLMGRTKDITGELAKASLLAVSSRVEGFGMTIIEGFSVGVPAVSFDCPHGPREIIEDGRNGLLVPDQDVDALGAALLRLVEDRPLREQMAAEALRSAADYGMDDIVRRWERFLSGRRAARGWGSRFRRHFPVLR
ncbi:glycosyltransferase family 4 protein [Nocardiopsis composta]|uniref:Glycosyltransferase involved in cell wall biosynthesis n=1 Tax=Nocardiopsis composta TaxID=157465 RepID=A0A7W8VDV3_9ACTN|nr:glycosyltransferase family 4 protein [Nocardiopsis composta]MBB5432881.1 glycosyltransferase involved in cell wall biosynthesis [Nocardiopsis composta]